MFDLKLMNCLKAGAMGDQVEVRYDSEVARDRAYRQEADEAADQLKAAFELAGLPPLPSLYGLATSIGGLVNLGGYNVHATRMLTEWITEHARCRHRVLDGTAVATADLILSTPNPAPSGVIHGKAIEAIEG